MAAQTVADWLGANQKVKRHLPTFLKYAPDGPPDTIEDLEFSTKAEYVDSLHVRGIDTNAARVIAGALEADLHPFNPGILSILVTNLISFIVLVPTTNFLDFFVPLWCSSCPKLFILPW